MCDPVIRRRELGSETARITADIVSAHLQTTSIASESLPEFIRKIHTVVKSLEAADGDEDQRYPPEATAQGAVDPDNWPGVFQDHIICLEDGAKVTLLRSYLSKRFQMDLSTYKAKWSLPASYPAVPPGYVERKRQIALRSGLGTQVRAHPIRAKDSLPSTFPEAESPPANKPVPST